MVRGCVHGGVVICEVRVAASPVVHDRADRAVPCAPLLGGVGDAARTRCAARQRARSCRPCGRNRWSGAPLPGVPVGKPPDWIPVGGPDRAASLVRAAPGTPRSASTSLNLDLSSSGWVGLGGVVAGAAGLIVAWGCGGSPRVVGRGGRCRGVPGSGGVLRGGWARQGAGRVWRRPIPWRRRWVQGWSAL